MQSNKPSNNKTRKNAENANAAAPETKAAGTTSKPRESRSSKPKNDVAETSPKRHRKAQPAAVSEPPQAVERISPIAAIPADEVRKLAYFYWLERGGQHGSHHDDWLRAERELLARA